jgi:hypothetical protein
MQLLFNWAKIKCIWLIDLPDFLINLELVLKNFIFMKMYNFMSNFINFLNNL